MTTTPRLQYTSAIVALAFGVAVGWAAAPGNPNKEATYGKSGLPKNCRALVQANIDGLRSRAYTVEEALASLERNCGRHGYNWDE